MPLLSGSRRTRPLGVALLLIVLVLWLSAFRQQPVDLHSDPPTRVPNLAYPPKDLPAQGAGNAEDALFGPSSVKVEPVKVEPLKVESVSSESSISTAPAKTKTEDAETALNGPGAQLTNAATTSTTTTDESAAAATSTEASAEIPSPTVECVKFEALQKQRPGPLSEGKRQFPYVRPPPECRTFPLPAMEDLIANMKKVIRDPDLFRLFENSYPNTLDTMIKWRGFAKVKNETTGEETETDEELTYVITGDIDAMWLRDSASQIYSYLPLLEASTEFESLASLWRGVINLHARYIVISPYCHAFQPPPESGVPPTHNGAYSLNKPNPPYNPKLVFDCKWELDSLASFLQISAAYFTRTGDVDFFGRYGWVNAVEAAVKAAGAMRLGTYDEEGHVLPSAWTFTGYTNRGSETLTNNGLGNPVKENGMVRSAFRPSDDACIFQLLTPSNMMFAAYLEQASAIMQGLAEGANPPVKAANLTAEMRKLAGTIRRGIARDAVVKHRDFGDIFAYEVDGYGGANLMDDANVPSLLALPLWNFTTTTSSSTTTPGDKPQPQQPGDPSPLLHSQPRAISDDTASDPDSSTRTAPLPQHDYPTIYRNTRAFILSLSNPYYSKGPVLSAVGGPHVDPGRGWPMAAIVAGLTAYEDLSGLASTPAERDEVVGAQLRAVLGSTAGTGVVHESVDAWNENRWTRSWFGWANGLFGELVLRVARDEEERGVLGGEGGLLGRLWQD